MERRGVLRFLSVVIALAGAALVALNAPTGRYTNAVFGGVALVGGVSGYWALGAYWDRYERFMDPEIEFGTRNTLYRTLLAVGGRIVQFGVIALYFTGIVGIAVSPADVGSAVVAGALVTGILLGAGLFAGTVYVDAVRAGAGTALGGTLVNIAPAGTFAGIYVVSPVAAVIFGTAWVVSRLVTLGIVHRRPPGA